MKPKPKAMIKQKNSPGGDASVCLDLDIDIVVESGDWSTLIGDVEAVCNTAARCGFEYACADGVVLDGSTAEIGIVLSSDDYVQNLNRDYRGLNKSTNVLSFGSLEEGTFAAPSGHPEGAPILLGDIIVAFETVEREAREENKQLAQHLSHMIIHGMLHLLGYDHESDGEAMEMEALEVKALAELGIRNPYDDWRQSQDNG